MRMDTGKFIKFVLNALETERKEQIQRQWTALLPFMALKCFQYLSFDSYYEKCTGANIDLRTTEEIIADIEETHKRAHMEKEGE